MSERRLRITLARRELCYILDALESLIEDYKYDGGLSLAEEYIELENRLSGVLRDLDHTGKRSV